MATSRDVQEHFGENIGVRYRPKAARLCPGCEAFFPDEVSYKAHLAENRPQASRTESPGGPTDEKGPDAAPSKRHQSLMSSSDGAGSDFKRPSHPASRSRQRDPDFVPVARENRARTPWPVDAPGHVVILQPEMRPISEEQLVAEVKDIHARLVMLESMCIGVDITQNSPNETQALAPEQWQALIELHRTLLHDHHDFFLASQHPSAGPALRQLASKYAMPARMWRHGIHSFLELLRYRLRQSLEYMLTFIYLAYSMMALLYETVPAFEDTWIECLGDLSRYRMAIEDDDIRDREVWTSVSRHWYSKTSDRAPTTGRLHHHLAILARPNAVQQLFYYTKSLCVPMPFMSARESISALFDPVMSGGSPQVRPSTGEIRRARYENPMAWEKNVKAWEKNPRVYKEVWACGKFHRAWQREEEKRLQKLREEKFQAMIEKLQALPTNVGGPRQPPGPGYLMAPPKNDGDRLSDVLDYGLLDNLQQPRPVDAMPREYSVKGAPYTRGGGEQFSSSDPTPAFHHNPRLLPSPPFGFLQKISPSGKGWKMMQGLLASSVLTTVVLAHDPAFKFELGAWICGTLATGTSYAALQLLPSPAQEASLKALEASLLSASLVFAIGLVVLLGRLRRRIGDGQQYLFCLMTCMLTVIFFLSVMNSPHEHRGIDYIPALMILAAVFLFLLLAVIQWINRLGAGNGSQEEN